MLHDLQREHSSQRFPLGERGVVYLSKQEPRFPAGFLGTINDSDRPLFWADPAAVASIGGSPRDSLFSSLFLFSAKGLSCLILLLLMCRPWT